MSREYQQIVRFFSGHIVNHAAYLETEEGFDRYLQDTGVRHTNAAELIKPRHMSIARSLGFTDFLPPRDWWPRSAALGMVFTRLREHVDAPIYIYNAYRPQEYNSHPSIGGAAASDHITNHAWDCDFNSAENRRKAEEWLRQYYDMPLLEMSLGLGGEKIHIGIRSPKGNRHWYYSSYPSSEKRPL